MIDSVKYKIIDGIKCCIINKEGFVEKQAMIAFKYGSLNNNFLVDKKEINLPPGIAHFLEHKMFEQDNYNVFEEFNKLGANVNAFTNFSTTAYYFSCTENFNKNFEYLLDFVSTPYFTTENVEKEKGIIAQEIKMYEDDPYWRSYFNLLSGMFGEDSNFSKDIAGKVDDIQQITKDMLYSCYENFYTKDNAIIICCGDFKNEQELYSIILKKLKINKEKKGIFKQNEEDWKINKNYVEKKSGLNQIIFNIGFKDVEKNGKIENNIISSKIILDTIFGKSSNFYKNMYNQGLIDNSFGFSYNILDNRKLYIFTGISNNPKNILNFIIDEILKFKKLNINQDTFTRIKNKHLGNFIMQFNSINSLVNMEAEFFCNGFGLKEYYETYKNIMLENINLKLQNFTVDQNVLSIMK